MSTLARVCLTSFVLCVAIGWIGKVVEDVNAENKPEWLDDLFAAGALVNFSVCFVTGVWLILREVWS